MSDAENTTPGKSPTRAAWVGIKARRRALRDSKRPQADPSAATDTAGQRTDARARLFALLSEAEAEGPQRTDPARAGGVTRKPMTVKIARKAELKQTPREKRRSELLRRHADEITRVRARKALKAEHDAQIAEVMEKEDFEFMAPP